MCKKGFAKSNFRESRVFNVGGHSKVTDSQILISRKRQQSRNSQNIKPSKNNNALYGNIKRDFELGKKIICTNLGVYKIIHTSTQLKNMRRNKIQVFCFIQCNKITWHSTVPGL